MDNLSVPKITDEKTARTKAEHYCTYQERSQQEVRNKLYEWGVYPSVVERVISELITGNYLNEERFALAYTKGKFNQKGWGRIKIKQGLKLKQVPAVLIKKALRQIPDDDYHSTLQKLLAKKAALIKDTDQFKRNYKLQQYALGRGFETDITARLLKDSGL